MSDVNFSGWLALRKTNPYRAGSMRLTKTKPTLNPGEIPLKIEINVPASLFEKPALKAVVKIPEGAVISSEIPTEIQTNIAEVIREQTGLLVEISLPEVESDE